MLYQSFDCLPLIHFQPFLCSSLYSKGMTPGNYPDSLDYCFLLSLTNETHRQENGELAGKRSQVFTSNSPCTWGWVFSSQYTTVGLPLEPDSSRRFRLLGSGHTSVFLALEGVVASAIANLGVALPFMVGLATLLKTFITDFPYQNSSIKLFHMGFVFSWDTLADTDAFSPGD